MLCPRRSGRWLSAITAAVIAGDVCLQGAASAQGPRSNSRPLSNSKTITWRAAETTQENCVAILGEIATPGAYCLEARSLSVQSLVRRAGGVTEEASMAIRLIRHERVNQTLFLSPQSDTPLMPGDVLIVESKRATLGTSKVMNVGNPANGVRRVAANAGDSQGVQVAYLNVLDRPVVVKLRNEEARLDHIVQMLGQPVELAGSVQVLGPDRNSNVAQLATASPRLTDGTVLVFRKGSINRNKLPATLPKPYDSEIAAGAFPSLIGGALGQSAELRSVGQLAPLMIAPGQETAFSPAPFSEPVPSLQAQAPVLSIPAFNPDPPSLQSPPIKRGSRPEAQPPRVEAQPSQMPLPETSIVSSRPRVATLPFTGSAPMRSSSSRGPIEPEPNAPPPEEAQPARPQQEDRGVGRSDSAPSLPTSRAALETLSNSKDSPRLPSSELTANESGATPFSTGQMFGILAGVSALIGAALVARKHFDKRGPADNSSPAFQESQRVQQTPIERALAATNSTAARTTEPESAIPEPDRSSIEPAPSPLAATLPAGMSDLDQLIKNTLPLREEAANFPVGINLQGRLAPRPIYRVDRAAENVLGSGPHFATSNKAETRTDRFETSEQFEPTVEQLDLDTHPAAETRLSGPHFGRRRSGAKTVAVSESSSAAMPVAPASNQSTPLADALRQLQGDRPS